MTQTDIDAGRAAATFGCTTEKLGRGDWDVYDDYRLVGGIESKGGRWNALYFADDGDRESKGHKTPLEALAAVMPPELDTRL